MMTACCNRCIVGLNRIVNKNKNRFFNINITDNSDFKAIDHALLRGNVFFAYRLIRDYGASPELKSMEQWKTMLRSFLLLKLEQISTGLSSLNISQLTADCREYNLVTKFEEAKQIFIKRLKNKLLVRYVYGANPPITLGGIKDRFKKAETL